MPDGSESALLLLGKRCAVEAALGVETAAAGTS